MVGMTTLEPSLSLPTVLFLSRTLWLIQTSPKRLPLSMFVTWFLLLTFVWAIWLEDCTGIQGIALFGVTSTTWGSCGGGRTIPTVGSASNTYQIISDRCYKKEAVPCTIGCHEVGGTSKQVTVDTGQDKQLCLFTNTIHRSTALTR